MHPRLGIMRRAAMLVGCKSLACLPRHPTRAWQDGNHACGNNNEADPLIKIPSLALFLVPDSWNYIEKEGGSGTDEVDFDIITLYPVSNPVRSVQTLL